ncbi:transcription factor bHLH94-like [Impatiens glandulifera]|uniref:transcription factor bHLH94-like n=1 Tax=Impatiens glandulifera TaxID=253017 RepID=UPI001FB0D24B|nr:transcription factor bHLH94-like [Impatiens glandulifera]
MQDFLSSPLYQFHMSIGHPVRREREVVCVKMALEEGVVYQDPFGYNQREVFNMLEANWFDFDLLNNQIDPSYWDQYPDPPLIPTQFSATTDFTEDFKPDPSSGATVGADIAPARSKRRRLRNNRRNQEEIEKQRMTHITVERNRRKQMNEYLSSLRQLMPASYVSRSDQASIIGSAINYVKELEQRLQLLNASHNHQLFRQLSDQTGSYNNNSSPEMDSSSAAAVADVEVTVVENHANLKIRSRKRPKQLLKMVDGLQRLRLTVLHLNVTTVDQIVLYSLSLKIEDDCQVNSGDEIASAVNEILSRIEEQGP